MITRHLPFEQLVDALRLKRSPSHAPLVQVMFALQNAPPTVRTIPGLTLDQMAVEQGTAKFDLTLSMRDTAARIARDVGIRPGPV